MSVSDGFLLVSLEKVYVCVSVYIVFFFTCYVCVFIHVFGGSIVVQVLCGRPAAWLRSDLIKSREEAARWVWFRRQKENGRKIDVLSEMKAFLQLPRPCLSGRGPLTDRGSPGTGRVIF